MSLLNFEKPKKVLSTKEHNEKHCSDSGVAGTYVPNMSEEDMQKWKAKHITGEHERIEIRKTIRGVQLLVIVYKHRYEPKYPSGYEEKWQDELKEWRKKHNYISISMNGKLELSYEDYNEMQCAIHEAFTLLAIEKLS